MAGRCRSVEGPGMDVANSCRESCAICMRGSVVMKKDSPLLDLHSCSRVGQVPRHVAQRYII